ncbi:hypothetical protein P3T35_008042 [Kitasatospora sp. GP30]|jgi:hypothetical protein|uniref:hypothetical protein n=1 Tax=Kitasatospora sp. GP30 TaxID=3035084 RepID=UPI000C70DE37|nr:hypothetical protein [Kitasatospora sp. GP30]MDH6145980.1 hypothetical protein [Kitasatospora sp. GP30]
MPEFRAGDRVKILSCETDPWAAGKEGRVLDDLREDQMIPSHLTGGRWSVRVDGRGWLSPGTALCLSYEIRKI